MFPPPETRADPLLLVVAIPALAFVGLISWTIHRDAMGLQEAPAAAARPAQPRSLPTRFPGP